MQGFFFIITIMSFSFLCPSILKLNFLDLTDIAKILKVVLIISCSLHEDQNERCTAACTTKISSKTIVSCQEVAAAFLGSSGIIPGISKDFPFINVKKILEILKQGIHKRCFTIIHKKKTIIYYLVLNTKSNVNPQPNLYLNTSR